MSYVGVPHGIELDGETLFFAHVHLHGGPAPVRRYLPRLIDLVWNKTIDPGKVFDLTLPLDQVAEDTARWTSAGRSRRCCVREDLNGKGFWNDYMAEKRSWKDCRYGRPAHLAVA